MTHDMHRGDARPVADGQVRRGRPRQGILALALAGLCAATAFAAPAQAAITCDRTVTADIVAFDKPIMYNRLGAGNVNGMMFALRRDVINTTSLLPLTAGGAAAPGQVDLRPDKRHRPLVLRVRKGDCLVVKLENLLTAAANPNNVPKVTPAGQQFTVFIDEQVVDRTVGFHAAGLQLVNGMSDDGSFVGNNGSSLLGTGQNNHANPYKLYAAKEGVFVVKSDGSTVGSDANQGNSGNGLFGQVIVEPTGAAIYRSQVFEEEMRLATAGPIPGSNGLPQINYGAVYPGVQVAGGALACDAANPTNPVGAVFCKEGKAGLPVLNMINPLNNEIVHSEINAVIAGPCTGVDSTTGCGGVGHFPKTTYPLESAGKRNPTLPNRLEPFRDFASLYHDEPSTAQAFPAFYVTDPVFRYVLAGVKDGFMINYGSGGIGSEIIANRLLVGPMHDCASCAYEEFFLTSFAVGDPALTTDVPANLGLEAFTPAQAAAALAALKAGNLGDPDLQFLLANNGRKANYVIGAEDPSNVHHSYTGDFVKFRNTHTGKEQHVFHLHNHQWLYNPNDDNSNYLDAQGIGPGVGYTYEINFGGSGNRNKSSGDSIFHCHFYPHFAQGMWYHWRHNDTFQTGTILAATPNAQDAQGYALAGGYHAAPWALGNTTPAAGARAYPDGEIATGTPIPALVPLPGKPMPPMPGRATVVAKLGGNGLVVGSNARVIDRSVNPGYPFWIAGMEDVIGQRPPTPVLDMLSKTQAAALNNAACQADPNCLWKQINSAQADGFDGGLPRHALQGYSDGAATPVNVVSPIDFSKVLHAAKPVYYPEEGTDLEQVAMRFHAQRCHSSFRPDGTAANCAVDANRTVRTATPTIGGFITNGNGGPVVGAPFHNPCVDDTGTTLANGVLGKFFSGESATSNPMSTRGQSVFNSDTPRIYKATNMQFDAVLTKTGYHYPQQRIVALWEDVGPVIAKRKPPEPLVFRSNTFDCTVLHHSNLVPEAYEIDDYQVRTPTDIIGQHIHLPKWDLTTTDGAANGWNYEDGTLSPGAVRERIEAINAWNATPGNTPVGPHLEPLPHPYFASVASALQGAPVGTLAAEKTFTQAWLGARTTIQRWFIDPVVNTEGTDRGLGIVFTHDHYGPSTHQQIGLYSTLLAEPANSVWAHNETGNKLGCATAVNPNMPAGTVLVNEPVDGCRWDGGPTSWQAAIKPQTQLAGVNVGAGALQPYREFYFEYSDFQHAYEAGVYMGTNQMGLPLLGTGPGLPPVVGNEGNPLFNNNPADAFRFAINPPARLQIAPVFPDLYLEIANTLAAGVNPGEAGNFCPTRPCPQAIDVQDPGLLVVNYRAEPVALRVYDPNRVGPDGKPGMQAAGQRGDLAYAFQTRTDRAIPQLNVMPNGNTVINGTRFPPDINAGDRKAGDPFTPTIRTFAGDMIRVKMQAGGHEEEHNASIHGMKWLQAGSGHGKAPNSGWRSAQAGGISEQFTLSIPVVPSAQGAGATDYLYSMDGGNDGVWSGMWGILRAYNNNVGSLTLLPGSALPVKVANVKNFANNTLCPADARGRALNLRVYDISAVLANQALPANANVTIQDLNPAGHIGGGVALNPAGGTLVYNPRTTAVAGVGADPVTGLPVAITHNGPIHDPTAILFVRTSDLDAAGKLKPGLKPEPVVIRANANECIEVVLRNRLPALAADGSSTTPELATYSMIQGVAKRDRFGPAGSTTFQSNLFRASSVVGFDGQLVAYDASRDSGVLVGTNGIGAFVIPGAQKTFHWYAGDVTATRTAPDTFTLATTPVEFGGANVLPLDRVKQGAKSAVGTLVIEPAGATWTEDADNAAAVRKTRSSATVTAPAGGAGSGGTYRDHSLVLTKGLTHYYADSSPVEHMNGEGVGIPEDSQEASGMAVNYGVEPLWFRAGILPQSAFGPTGYGGIPDQNAIYTNAYRGINSDPATPVITSGRGQATRIHITNPFGTTRGSTFALHGHLWQRDPYVCPAEARNTLTGACNMTGTGSKNLGVNPQAFAQSGQESWNAPSHFDIVLPGTPGPDGRNWPAAGGDNAVAGDYLFRDGASFGNASGVWGILRVQ